MSFDQVHFATHDVTLADRLLATLRDHGARAVFGIPGDFALPLFKIIERSGILPLHTLTLQLPF